MVMRQPQLLRSFANNLLTCEHPIHKRDIARDPIANVFRALGERLQTEYPSFYFNKTSIT